MNEIIKLVSHYFSESTLNVLAKRIGESSIQNTRLAVDGIIAVLLKAISINISTDYGAESFYHALIKSHDGSILNEVPQLFEELEINNSNELGLLSNVLGDSIHIAIKGISKLSNIDKSKIGTLFLILTPIIIGIIGYLVKDNKINSASDLVNSIKDLGKEKNDESLTEEDDNSLFQKLLNFEIDDSLRKEVLQFGMKYLLKRLLF